MKNKRADVKRAILLVISIGMTCFTLTGCHFQHKWTEATCTEPKTCSVGGETEGEPLGHDWTEATCKEPKTCSRCGKKEGKALGHKPGNWEENDDSTEEVKRCTTCGDIVKRREISMDGTIRGFCKKYNTLLAVYATSGDNNFSMNDYEKYKLDFDNMNDEGSIPVGDMMSIEINPTSERKPSSKVDIANFLVKDISAVDGDKGIPIFLSYLTSATEEKLSRDQYTELYNYFLMSVDSPPVIDGYEFVRYGVGSVLLFQTKVL